MGRRGPAQKPTHLKILDGAPEAEINRNEPTPTESSLTELLTPPVPMTAAAKKFWNRLVPDLVDKGVMTAWDQDQFVLLCETLAIWHSCRKKLGREYTARGAAGGVIKSPYWQIMRDAQTTITQISARYGLTPSDRAALVIKDADQAPQKGSERLLS
ncbi:phage terminase small subunit P27 family [Gordonia sp. N1V]|uniref:phage terminase small subunit P27 family n=1 Tax=Gordonia sp. N1V TaxID=3034163 RepID=UPI0023E2954E|nr:phage terminase small subunit P27 family [Gordonia sp. N1V]MDF3280909.1 phage terminase small subunit P27 family [Gordonia sp. N1V]